MITATSDQDGSASAGSSGEKTKLIQRVGYGAKGALYAVLGFLTLYSVFGPGSDVVGFKESMTWVGKQPLGYVFLGILGFGILVYSFYRFACAFVDSEDVGKDPKGIAKRIGYLGSGLAYLSLAAFAGSKILGGSGSDSDAKESLGATLISSKGGQIVLWVTVAGMLGAAGVQFVKMLRREMLRREWEFNSSGMATGTRRILSIAASFGFLTRSVVYALIAYLLSRAIFTADADEVGGMEDALGFVSSETAGPWILASVALGLIGYAIYALAISRFGIRHSS